MTERALPGVVLVKFGGSLLTDKAGDRALREDVLSRLARELATAHSRLRQSGYGLIVGHGSGSFGHRAALEVGYDSANETRDIRPASHGAAIRRAALELHGHVLAALCSAGLPAFSFPPAGFMAADGGELELASAGALQPLEAALEGGYLPIVFGDVIIDSAFGFSIASTEEVFLQLARSLSGVEVRVALWFGETDGVLENGRTVPSLLLDQARPAVAAPRGSDVTGGMEHRLDAAYRLAHEGTPSGLLNGLNPGAVERALVAAAGGSLASGTVDSGTWIQAQVAGQRSAS